VYYTASTTVSGGFRFAPAAAATAQSATAGATAAGTNGAAAAQTATASTAAGGVSFVPAVRAPDVRLIDDQSDYAPEDDYSDADTQEEEDQERAKVAAAFAKLNPAQPDVIPAIQLPALFQILHVAYCEEWHARPLAALFDAVCNVSLQQFSDWYMHWLFTDDDTSSSSYYDSSDYEDSYEDSLIAAAAAAVKAAANTRRGSGTQFRPAAGSWRCECCRITNTADIAQCAACEAPSPATPATVL
jgi:hypothetical protein